MTVTHQLEIIDNKIKANQNQYDLNILAAKISAYSSGDLRKYKYLTVADLGYKPRACEQPKFNYSQLGNIFTKGLDKEDQKEGLFKRPENIKNKNEELLNAFIAGNKVSKAAKNESEFNYESRYVFNRFDRMSLGFKYSELKEFSKLLSDFKNLKPLTAETKDCKDRIMKNVNQLYNKYFYAYKKFTIVKR